MKAYNDWKFVIMATLTMGLAPFYPEPHFFGKVRWVMGGAVGMGPMDWFDFIMHGLPWLLLLRLSVLTIFQKNKVVISQQNTKK
ncbi:MAG TPA: hypothetical protein ENJ53_06115 [Phaeodactylibacter sp.]|nr:hypothetical protein [Phaeodactylibacter sp.]